MTKPIVGAQLRAFVERIERLDEEIKSLNDDKRDIYAEAKGNGYDVKVLKAIIARRRKDADEVAEMDSVMQLYLAAIGETGTEPAKYRERAPARAQAAHSKLCFQAPRLASLSEIKSEFQAGQPISGDERHRGGSVYFAHFPGLGRLKIGLSNDVAARLEGICAEIGAQYQLLGTFPGNRQVELEALRAFQRFNLMGEWFEFTSECEAAAKDYLATRARATQAA